MNASTSLRLTFFLSAICALAQPKQFALESAAGLRGTNVSIQAATHEGKRGVRVGISEEARKRVEQLGINDQSASLEQIAFIEGTEGFSNGVIEAEIAGAPGPNAPAGARGFVGIAFRVQPDMRTYDAFYLRPTNGRADDQVRRNHSAQYISHPEWTWQRFRKESPEKYESYVDLVPNAWTRIRIEVHGTNAKLFVHGQSQPTLIVSDLKTGPSARGGVALWINPGTLAHFRDVRVTPSKE